MRIEQVHFRTVVHAIAIGIRHERVCTDLVDFVHVGKAIAVGVAIVVYLQEVDVFHVPQVEQEIAHPGTRLHIHSHLFGVEVIGLEGHFRVQQGNPVKGPKTIPLDKQRVGLAAPILGEGQGIDSQEARTVSGVLLENEVCLARKRGKGKCQDRRCK